MGHRLDVWQVVETVKQEGGRVEAAAEYLGVSLGLVAAAIDYYAVHADEVEAWIERNVRTAKEAEAAWPRR
jgi:uncharacterized protein (DUF433 family)